MIYFKTRTGSQSPLFVEYLYCSVVILRTPSMQLDEPEYLDHVRPVNSFGSACGKTGG